jgi:hypothetical protein
LSSCWFGSIRTSMPASRASATIFCIRPLCSRAIET